MKTVGMDEVIGFTETNSISGSYLQLDKHSKLTERFKPIQAAAVGNALAAKGFSLVGLITGKGRHADKVDFQRTISRYRSADAFGIDGLSLDLIYISKHLGRGQDELRLGMFRGVCANQWSAGTLFEMVKFRHSGDPLKDITNSIEHVLSQRTKLVETIQRMQNTFLTPVQVSELAKQYAMIRLAGKENVVNVDFTSLNMPRRQEDSGTDLWTVANVLQENVISSPMVYSLQTVNKKGEPAVRQMHTRVIKDNSTQLVELNAKLFDEALKLAA